MVGQGSDKKGDVNSLFKEQKTNACFTTTVNPSKHIFGPDKSKNIVDIKIPPYWRPFCRIVVETRIKTLKTCMKFCKSGHAAE